MRAPRLSDLALLCNTVTVQIITYAYRPALAYAALDAGGMPALLGIMSAVFAVPALLLAIPVGRLVDRASERFVGTIGALLIAVSVVIALVAPHSFSALLISTLIFGVAHLCCIVCQQTFVANRARQGRSDSAFGWYTLIASIGQALGPMLLAVPGDRPDRPPVDLIFLICLVLGSVMLLTAVALSPLRRPSAGEGDRSGTRGAARSLMRGGTFRALIASGIALASIDITLVYWPALGDERGVPPTVISAMLVVRAVATMASRGFLGWSTGMWGRRGVMFATLGASTVALGATALPLPDAGMVVASLVYGLGIGACQPITMAWLSGLARPGERGTMLSLRLVGNRLAQSTVPAVAGLVAASAGSAGVIAVLAGFLSIATWAGRAVPDVEPKNEG